MDLEAGFTVKNRYTIRGKLGAGGMGTVYLAYDSALNSEVALKSNLSGEHDGSEQFLKEAQVLAGLRHPNLPRVTDHFVEGGIQYLVMDFIPGGDLSARMKKFGIQPVSEVITWARQLASALDYMHSLDPPVIHRDIKPGNIKIKPDGRAVLVDFGLVKSSESNVTLTGARGFTPGYAPPEQYSAGQTGPYSDQYSLAATMYAMLTGTAPAEAVRRMMGEIDFVPAHQMNPKIPRNVSEALTCALSLMPENRFANMKDFMVALQDSSFKGRTRLSTSVEVPGIKAEKRGAPRWLLPVGLGVTALFVVVVLAVILIGGGLILGNNGSSGGTTEPTEAAFVVPVDVTEASNTLVIGPTATTQPSNTPQPTYTATIVQTPTLSPTPQPSPTFTGSGGLIAFVSDRSDDGTFQIFTMRPDGSEVTQITFDAGDKSQPCWSPDGSELLFVADGGGSLGLEIYRYDFTAAIPLNLTNSTGDDYDPAWSGDGTKIGFTSERVNNLRQVFVMNDDGSEQQFWSRGYAVEFEPFWSPAGDVLAVVASINDAPGEIFLRTGMTTSEEVNTTRFDLQNRLGGVLDISWSSDGEYFAYTRTKSGQKDIFIVEVESRGTKIFELTNSLNNKEPDWSPDDQWIVFTFTQNQNSEIYLMDRAGGQVTQLTDHAATDKEPAWQP